MTHNVWISTESLQSSQHKIQILRKNLVVIIVQKAEVDVMYIWTHQMKANEGYNQPRS